MEIELKKSTGSQVWLMYKNKATCGIIENIKYHKFISNTDFKTVYEGESYDVYIDGESIGWCKDTDIYDSKEDLIESL